MSWLFCSCAATSAGSTAESASRRTARRKRGGIPLSPLPRRRQPCRRRLVCNFNVLSEGTGRPVPLEPAAVGGADRLEELRRTRRPGLDHRGHQQERYDRCENREDLRHDSLLELLELRKPSP